MAGSPTTALLSRGQKIVVKILHSSVILHTFVAFIILTCIVTVTSSLSLSSYIYNTVWWQRHHGLLMFRYYFLIS